MSVTKRLLDEKYRHTRSRTPEAVTRDSRRASDYMKQRRGRLKKLVMKHFDGKPGFPITRDWLNKRLKEGWLEKLERQYGRAV